MQDGIRRSTELEKVDSGHRRGRIDPSWHQGRGAFGGFAAALLLSAMEEDVADADRVPRSLTVHFCAPCVGDFDLRSEVVRAGTRVTHAASRIANAGGVMTMATASFCRDRENAARHSTAVMPSVERPDECRELPAWVTGLPAFFRHVDVRFCGDVKPFTGAKEARIAAWVRVREEHALDVDAPVAALLLDVLPPAISATFQTPRPMASVDFTIHFFERLPRGVAKRDEHLLVSIVSRWSDHGYTEELRDLWTSDGVLVAQCRQLLALL